MVRSASTSPFIRIVVTTVSPPGLKVIGDLLSWTGPGHHARSWSIGGALFSSLGGHVPVLELSVRVTCSEPARRSASMNSKVSDVNPRSGVFGGTSAFVGYSTYYGPWSDR